VEVLLDGHEPRAQGGAKEPIVADLHEVMGQDMLQEAMDELLCVQRTTFFCAGLGVAIPEGEAVIFQFQETVVAQGDSENIRRQILERIQTRAHAFTVYNPLLLPDLRRDPCIPSHAT